ncbi:transcription factor GTE4 [Ricinus communis]|uniref:transcription factor GTE4 n=1 Tax=Ricinus communis TaxID=3988 RepID=UPI00201AA115|nr:transcription factor GTE4 [Ricinus communis]
MATGPTNTSSNKKVYAQKLQTNYRNTSRIPQSTPPPPLSQQQQKPFDTVASDDDSSSHSHLPYNGRGNLLPGYVKLDDKVRISLNCGSKSVIRELKRKLVSELDQVRSLKKRLEAKETQFNGSNRTGGTLARVNSEVSYVGPTNSRPLQKLADNTSNNNHFENLDKEKKTSKVNHKKEKVLGSENIKKKLKTSNEPKKGGEGNIMGRCNREVFKKCEDLLEKLMKHQYGWVFNKPVDVKKLKLHDYFKIIKHPMDLGTVKSRLKKNWYKSPKEFAEDVKLTFNNAMKYNDKGQDAHIMADVLLKLFEEHWAIIEPEFINNERVDMGYDAGLPRPAPNRASAPPAPAPSPVLASAPLRKMPSESKILDRSESMTKPMNSSMKAANMATHEGRLPMSKKPKEIDPQRREMTFEEKQRLSADLLDMPSDKLDSVVQIIRKRNPGLCQQDDEIEVDIDSFDSETLWELDRLVNNHKKGLTKDSRIAEPTFQARGEAGHNIEETNLTSRAAEAPEESEAVDKFVVTSSIQREKQGDNVSRSSRSSSSSSDSGSSSNDSDSGSSSGYGSDAGQ